MSSSTSRSSQFLIPLLAILGLASTAHADTISFIFTAAGTTELNFTLPSQPTPSSFTSNGFEIDQGTAYVTPPGTPTVLLVKYNFGISGNMSVDNFVFGCGFCTEGMYLLSGGPELFTGPTSSPTFLTGTFAETQTIYGRFGSITYQPGSLVVEDTAAATPEPTTLLLAALGTLALLIAKQQTRHLRRTESWRAQRAH
jgi:hypothetical protein